MSRKVVADFTEEQAGSNGIAYKCGPLVAATPLKLLKQGINHWWKEVLLVGGDFQKIDHPFRKFASATEAGSWLRQQKVQGACLLVKGSRSMQMEKVLDYLKEQ